MSETITRVYELGYILAPTVPDTEVDSVVGALKEQIARVEGAVRSEGAPEFIDLAYTMEKTIASKKAKYSQGYFGWMKFESSPEAMEALKKALDGMTEVVRYLLIKTSLENEVIFKKPKIEARREAAVSLDEEVLVEDAAEGDDDLKEDHELLPDVANDIEAASAAAPEAAEPEEKESE